MPFYNDAWMMQAPSTYDDKMKDCICVTFVTNFGKYSDGQNNKQIGFNEQKQENVMWARRCDRTDEKLREGFYTEIVDRNDPRCTSVKVCL